MLNHFIAENIFAVVSYLGLVATTCWVLLSKPEQCRNCEHCLDQQVEREKIIV